MKTVHYMKRDGTIACGRAADLMGTTTEARVTCRKCLAALHREKRAVYDVRQAAGPRAARTGGMTVAEAGRKGGVVVRDTYGHDFYVEIGHKGGQKVRELIAAGKRAQHEKE